MQDVEYWQTDKLIAYASNPRHNDHAVDKVTAMIKEFGFKVPIIAKSDGTVIDGHLRLKCAKKLNLDKVSVIVADDLTEAQIKAFRIAINQSAELADWNIDLFKIEVEGLQELDFDIDLLGFDDDFTSKMMNDYSNISIDDIEGCIISDSIIIENIGNNIIELSELVNEAIKGTGAVIRIVEGE